MAVQPAMLTLPCGEAAPQDGAALARAGETAERQRQREAHGGRLVVMAPGRHIMQPGAGQALGGQVAVDGGKPGEPGFRLRLRPRQPGLGLFKPRDLAAQGGHQER